MLKICIFDKIYVKIRNVVYIWFLLDFILKIRSLLKVLSLSWFRNRLCRVPFCQKFLHDSSPFLHDLIHDFRVFISFCSHSFFSLSCTRALKGLFSLFSFGFAICVCECSPFLPWLDLGMLHTTHYFCDLLVVLLGLLELPAVWLFIFFFPHFFILFPGWC